MSASTGNDAVQDLWNDEGDDFFGHSTLAQGNVTADKGEEDGPATTTSRGKKRKGAGPSGVSRTRKTGGKANGRKKAAANDAGSGMDV